MISYNGIVRENHFTSAIRNINMTSIKFLRCLSFQTAAEKLAKPDLNAPCPDWGRCEAVTLGFTENLHKIRRITTVCKRKSAPRGCFETRRVPGSFQRHRSVCSLHTPARTIRNDDVIVGLRTLAEQWAREKEFGRPWRSQHNLGARQSVV